MAFLFQDQNQGTRNDEPRAWIARVTATVLFHPDFNRRLRICTESADPSLVKRRRSRAWAHRPYRRWGLSPRPENIDRLGTNRSDENYGQRPGSQQAALAWKILMVPMPGTRTALTPSPRASRGRDEQSSLWEGRGEGLSPQTRKARVRGEPPHPDRISDAIRPLPARGARWNWQRIKNSPFAKKLTTSYRHESDSGLFSC